MGRDRLWRKLCCWTLGWLVLFDMSSFSQARVQVLELLKDRDVQRLYATAAAKGAKIVARVGTVVQPGGEEQVLWLFVRDGNIGYKVNYFKTIDGHMVLLVFMDSSVNDTALRELLK